MQLETNANILFFVKLGDFKGESFPEETFAECLQRY